MIGNASGPKGQNFSLKETLIPEMILSGSSSLGMISKRMCKWYYKNSARTHILCIFASIYLEQERVDA